MAFDPPWPSASCCAPDWLLRREDLEGGGSFENMKATTYKLLGHQHTGIDKNLNVKKIIWYESGFVINIVGDILLYSPMLEAWEIKP